MKKVTLIVIATLFFSGCGTYQKAVMRERTITLSDGKQIKVNARKDDMIIFEKAGMKLTVDGRSKASFVTDMLKLMMMNTDFSFSNRDQIVKE